MRDIVALRIEISDGIVSGQVNSLRVQDGSSLAAKIPSDGLIMGMRTADGSLPLSKLTIHDFSDMESSDMESSEEEVIETDSEAMSGGPAVCG